MAEPRGEKTEQPTPRRLEEAWKRGQIARSAEVQTVAVLTAVLLALLFAGRESWGLLLNTMAGLLAHLHDLPVSLNMLQGYAVNGSLLIGSCVWPVLAAAVIAALLAGGAQSRFRTASEALTVNWSRLDPVEGFKRVFSFRSAVPTLLAIFKLAIVMALAYGTIQSVLTDPIFYSSVDVARIAGFMAESAYKIVFRVAFALALIAAADYGYQLWRTNQDLMMTKEEVKEEMKHTEGNPLVKAARRRRRLAVTKRQMLAEVPKADVVVTNPTRLAVALRYDRRTMKAPKIVAKGARWNALRIREIAQQHQVPILENKPLARTLFKYGRVGGEIPAQLYAAVAEVLAWVYRVNAYRYYRESVSRPAAGTSAEATVPQPGAPGGSPR
jgi:flagellar biosynthetic protein FlhB